MFADSSDDGEDGNSDVVRRSQPNADQFRSAQAQITTVDYGNSGVAKRGPKNVLAPDLGSSIGAGQSAALGNLMTQKSNVITLGVQPAESTEDLEAARQINMNELQSLLA